MDFPKSVPSVGLVDGKFVDEDVVAGTPGSLIPAQWGNAVTEEVLNVIASEGLIPDEDNNAQLLAAINAKIAAAIPDAPPDASTTVKGVVELATSLETQTGTDTQRAVTPVALSARTATDTRTGLVELATDLEIQAGTDTQRAVTPAGLKLAYGLGDSALVADINNAATGYFYAAPGATNSPGSGIVFGETRGASGSTGKSQTCIDISTRILYRRAYNGGSWSPWASIIDSTTLATETVSGIAQVATQAITNAGTNDTTIVTPKKLKAGFSVLLAQNGYISFPSWLGGVTIQWGRKAAPSSGSTDTVTFNTPFPTLCSYASFNLENTSGAASTSSVVPSTSSMAISISPAAWTAGINYRWWSIGW